MAAAQFGTVLRHIRYMAAGPKFSMRTDGYLLRTFLRDKNQSAFEALMRARLRIC
jgi:hypothetical protein